MVTWQAKANTWCKTQIRSRRPPHSTRAPGRSCHWGSCWTTQRRCRWVQQDGEQLRSRPHLTAPDLVEVVTGVTVGPLRGGVVVVIGATVGPRRGGVVEFSKMASIIARPAAKATSRHSRSRAGVQHGEAAEPPTHRLHAEVERQPNGPKPTKRRARHGSRSGCGACPRAPRSLCSGRRP